MHGQNHIKFVIEIIDAYGFLYNKHVMYVNTTTAIFAEDNLHGIFHKAQNHLPREKGWQWNGGVGEGVVVHTKAFPVPKIYGTKSPLTKRQLWVLLYVGSCITVITTLERGLLDHRGASDGRRGAVCLWPRRGVDVMQTARCCFCC